MSEWIKWWKDKTIREVMAIALGAVVVAGTKSPKVVPNIIDKLIISDANLPHIEAKTDNIIKHTYLRFYIIPIYYINKHRKSRKIFQ